MRLARTGVLGSNRGYSTEYQAVLDRATSLGYIQPSSAQKTKQNQLILDLKASGIWDLLDVFYVFATDGSSDFATLNWKASSTFQCSKVNTPTHGAMGFTFNGTTNYLNPAWVPSTNGVYYALNSAGIFVHENTNVATGTAAVSAISDTGARYMLITPKNNLNNCGYAVNSNGAATSVSLGAETSVGFYLGNRISSTNVNLFKNGVKIGVDTAQAIGAGRPTITPYIGARNNSGVADAFRGSQISCFGAGANFESVQSALYTAWNTYLTSL
jgi:hypothetical protein